MAIVGADEIHAKISSLVESQFPEFLRDEGPRFVNFLKAYYEYLEQASSSTGPGPINAIRSLHDYNDIDRTLDAFVDNFHNEFMVQIPKNALADKRLLVKHIRDFYRTRGSQQSYRFLFRALFDLEVEFYYPGEDILRASDGRWAITTTISVGPPFTKDPTLFEGMLLTGGTSGATGLVQDATRVVVRGATSYNLALENVSGTFVDGEVITDEGGDTAQISADSGSLVNVVVIDGGAYHNKGDTIRLTGQDSGATGTGTVLNVGSANAATITVVDGGSGYEVGANSSINVIGGSGVGLIATITGLSNTTNANLATQQILPVANCDLTTTVGSRFFISQGANTTAVTAKFATANATSTLLSAFNYATVQVGAINKIRITDPGYGYSTLPAISALSERSRDLQLASLSYTGTKLQGEDAILVSNTASGSVVSISITAGGTSFRKDETVTYTNLKTQTDTDDTYQDRDNITRTTTRAAHYDGSGTGKVSGVVTNPGKYTDTKGFLSWNRYLQDNYYYQEYSYVIQAAKQIADYKEIIKKVLHPAGTKMFGQMEILIEANIAPTTILTLPLDHNLAQSDAANANDSVVGAAVRTANIVGESITSTDSTVGAAVRTANIVGESVSSTDSVVGVAIRNFANVAESVTSTDSVVGAAVRTANLTGSSAETVTSTDSPVVVVDFSPAVTESVTSTDSIVGAAVRTANLTGSSAESVTAADTTFGEHFILDQTYIAVQYANNIISPYASSLISVYSAVTVGAFDGKPRFVVSVSPDAGTTASFANGALKANAGSISVSGYGSNLIVVPVGGSWDGSTYYAVNTIISATAFTLRTNHVPATSNAQFSYSTAT